MRIGVDFDNTIVCYDQVIHRVALENGWVTPDVPVSKGRVRDHMRQCDREKDWIELQGYVYGARMNDAQPYPGALEFFRQCLKRKIDIYIISHKTLHPFMGPQYDLHEAARGFLEAYGFFDAGVLGLPREKVFLELTKQEKIERIGSLDCTHFIDDLPEFLGEPSFPRDVVRILFDPNRIYASEKRFLRVDSWATLADLLAGPTDPSPCG